MLFEESKMICKKCGVEFIDTNIQIDNTDRDILQDLMEESSCGNLSISPDVINGIELSSEELYNFVFREMNIAEEAVCKLEIFLLELKSKYKELGNYDEEMGLSALGTIMIHPNTRSVSCLDISKKLNVFSTEEESIRLFKMRSKSYLSLIYASIIDNYLDKCELDKCKIVLDAFIDMSVRSTCYYYRYLEYLLNKYSLNEYANELGSITIDIKNCEFVLLKEENNKCQVAKMEEEDLQRQKK